MTGKFRIHKAADGGWLLEYPDGYWSSKQEGASWCSSFEDAVDLLKRRVQMICALWAHSTTGRQAFRRPSF